MKREEMDDVLRATLEDNYLSRGERHAIKELLSDSDPKTYDEKYFRSRAFALARERMPTPEARAVLEWLEGVVRATDPPQSREVSEVHFSPGPSCLRAIASRLKHAAKSVDICVFTITDDRLAKEILAAHERGVLVRIITDDDKAHDRGSDVHRLAQRGVEVRVDKTEHHMHHKFAIFDDDVVVTGSYNWTRSAAEYNAENLLVTDDSRLVKPYRRRFDELWRKVGER